MDRDLQGYTLDQSSVEILLSKLEDKWRETRKRKKDSSTESSSIRFHKNFKFHRMLKPSDFLEVLVEKWNQPPNTNTPRR